MRLPLTLHPRRSPALTGALVLAHGAVGVGLALVGVSVGYLWLATTILCGSLLYHLVLRNRLRPPPKTLILGADGALAVEFETGTACDVEVLPATTVLPGLVVLHASVAGAAHAWVYPVDALGRDAHRGLRLWLRWRARPV